MISGCALARIVLFVAISVVLAALACAFACVHAPPTSLLICHNANCASPGTVDRDDKLASLEASLALRVDGRPVIDGVEIDNVWDSPSSRCLFAHGAGDPAPDLSEAVQRIVDHLAAEGPASWNGARFYVKIELKPGVDADGHGHSAADASAHADCILDQLETLERVGVAHGRAITVLLDSAEPTLLLAITQRPRWPGKRPGGPFEVKLEVDYDTGVPVGLEPDVLTIRWGAIDDSMRDDLAIRGKNVLSWGRDPSAATLSQLAYLSPTFIGSNDALLMRGWLEGGR
jgi:hypothetical protein